MPESLSRHLYSSNHSFTSEGACSRTCLKFSKRNAKNPFIRAKHPVMIFNPVIQFDRSYALFIIPVNQAKSQCGGIMVPVDEFNYPSGWSHDCPNWNPLRLTQHAASIWECYINRVTTDIYSNHTVAVSKDIIQVKRGQLPIVAPVT